MECLVEASTAICEGEICSVDTVEPLKEALGEYTFKVAHKTAALFEAAGRVGALCAGAGSGTVAALGRFGHALGMAFQIIDDVLDYVGDEQVLGKPAGGDLRRGLITLPLIYAVAHDDADRFLRGIVEHLGDTVGPGELAGALQRVQSSSGPGRARQDAERYREEALQYLTLLGDPFRPLLEEIAGLVVGRRH